VPSKFDYREKTDQRRELRIIVGVIDRKRRRKAAAAFGAFLIVLVIVVTVTLSALLWLMSKMQGL
jgi:hypothetical protein